MPWCEPCGRFYNPNTLDGDGSCPACHRVIVEPRPESERPPARVPWHFWVLVAATVLYLGWRLVQMIGWLV